MVSKSKRRRKKIRRERNRQRHQVLDPKSTRVRKSFIGKSRSGDVVQIALEFSDTTVPFDPESDNFAEETARRHLAIKAWETSGFSTTGSA